LLKPLIFTNKSHRRTRSQLEKSGVFWLQEVKTMEFQPQKMFVWILAQLTQIKHGAKWPDPTNVTFIQSDLCYLILSSIILVSFPLFYCTALISVVTLSLPIFFISCLSSMSYTLMSLLPISIASILPLLSRKALVYPLLFLDPYIYCGIILLFNPLCLNLCW
jgi:hypothetical protein